MEIFTEVANNYDIDGIEFDFRRWIHMVSRPHENHTVLTRMVRQTRTMLDEVARRKGRKRLLLGARVGPTIAGQSMGANDMSCKDLGLDVKTWIDHGLVDYLCPSLFWPRLPGLPRTKEFVELARGTRVGVYPTVWPVSEWMVQGADKGPVGVKDVRKLRRYRDDICKAALQAYADGADGLSTFNWVPHHQPGMTRRNTREEWGLGALKVQMRVHALLRDRAALEAYLRSETVLPE
jgi:hypothetical protein